MHGVTDLKQKLHSAFCSLTSSNFFSHKLGIIMFYIVDFNCVCRLKILYYFISVLRFGKSLDFIQGALKSLHLKDTVLRLTLTLSKINQACYLLFDHFLWFHNVGAVKLDKQFWSEVSSRFYLATLLLNLIRDFYDIYCVLKRDLLLFNRKKSSSEYKNGDSNYKSVRRHQTTIVEVLDQNKPLVIDTVKNLFDLAIPMSTLKMISLSPQKQGLFGVISSLLAAVTVWDPKLKIIPS